MFDRTDLRRALRSSIALVAAALTLGATGCATVPPEPLWVCEMNAPCYQVVDARPYAPAYAAYPAWWYGGYGRSRPNYYRSVPAPSAAAGGGASTSTPTFKVVPPPPARPSSSATPSRRYSLGAKSIKK